MNKKIGRPHWNPPVELFAEYPALSITALAAKHGVARETIKNALLRGKVDLRSQEKAIGTIPWSDEDLETIRRLYVKELRSIRFIAISMDVGYKAIRNALIRSEVPLRKRNTKGLHQVSKATRKKISAAKSGKPGKPLSPEQKQHLREINTGRKHSEKTRAKMSETRIRRGLSKGSLNPMANEDVIKKWILSNNIRPNKAESRLKDILDELLPGEYGLNVTGEILILGGKIPDLVCVTGQHKVIELYGDYWHAGEDPNNRIEFFQQFGYCALVIWERELKGVDIRNRILQFHKEINNGVCRGT